MAKESEHYWKKTVESVTVRTTDGEIITFSTNTEGETIRKIVEGGYIRQVVNRNNEPKFSDRLEWYEIEVRVTTEKSAEVIDS